MTTPSHSDRPRMSSRKKLGLVIGGIILVLVLLGSVALFSTQIFVKRSDGPVVRAITNTLPVPAARLGSRVVLYRDFTRSRDTLKKFLASPAAQEQEMAVPFDTELERNALEKLLVQEALEELAAEKGVTVSNEELLEYFGEVLSATSSTTPDPGRYLYDTFGWNEEDFRQEVLRPALLEQRLGLKMAEEDPNDPNALATYIDARLQRDDVVRYVRF